MMSSLYIGASGLKTHGEGLGVISHNIANVNTIGYKQQSMQFDDIFYATLPLGSGWESQVDSKVAFSQAGMGVRPGEVRTLFTMGPIESGANVFDMAILGKGFFQVTDPETNLQYYTRAGDFYLNRDAILCDPNGCFVTGIPIATGESAPAGGPLTGGGPIVIDPRIACPPKATTEVALSMNIGISGDNAVNDADPYFSLLRSWNAMADPPLDRSLYGYVQPVSVYDADGQKQDLMLYMDMAPGPASGKVVEYILARPPADPAQAVPGEGLLMAGTLSFSGSGQLIDMSAFTPTDVSMDLADWVPAALANGLPQFTLNGQSIGLDLGIKASGGWQHPPATAMDVGANTGALPGMGQVTARAGASTAYGGATTLGGLRQDGYAEGMLMDIDISAKGVVIGIYSNGQNVDLYQIPLCRFTSEDGLRHEGNNLYSSTPDRTGPMTMGVPDTENYGAIMAKHIEASNVELSREVTLMILMQRGFQMNSKSVTTADTMLQRAIELKRS